MILTIMARVLPPIPGPAIAALRRLGSDIRDARRRRSLSTDTVAGRALITRTTLRKVERGDPSVSLGIYATVLYVLGLLDRLAALADPGQDLTGLTLESDRLPQRVRSPRRLWRYD